MTLATVAEADAYATELARVVSLFPPGVKPVLCADHRPVSIYSQPVADRLAELFSVMNSRLECAALLAAATNATFAMQLGRIVREAHNPARRVFDDAVDAATFLGRALDRNEQARLHLFLTGFDPDEAVQAPPTPRSSRLTPTTPSESTFPRPSVRPAAGGTRR